MRDLPVDEALRALAVAQKVALFEHPALQRNVWRMLFSLDRYWRAFEGMSPEDWDRLWWESYERYRERVEAALCHSRPTWKEET